MSQSSISPHTDARIDRLFARLSAIYGHIWQSQFKQESFLVFTKKEWSTGLRGIENESIKLAIEECKKTVVMPPTLPTFYQLCRNFQVCNRKMPLKVVEIGQVTPGVATKSIAQIREELSQKIMALKGVQ